MEPMVYKLNLPPLKDCVLDGVLDSYFFESNKNLYNRVNANHIFKPQYLEIHGYNWNTVLIFYKNDSKVVDHAHTDTDYPNLITTWAINWIYKNDGFMEFWDLDKIPKEELIYVSDKHSYNTRHYYPTTPPHLVYKMTPGAYLVNTTYPHRAFSHRPRYCASFRTTEITTPWSAIVYQFKDLIDYSFLPME